MLKLLLKKQLLEIFRSYYYDAKKNTARSKASTAAYLVGFALLMVVVLGGLFTFVSAKLCTPMAAAGMDWLYFALMGLLAVLLGAFGSVFNTYAGVYLAKDNDLLLSMPIPVSVLLASRLLTVYLMGLMYSGLVIVPAVIVYWAAVKATLPTVLGGLLLTLLISVFVMTLSCALGWVVAKISLKLKHKSFITVIVSLVFIGVYYFFYFRAQTMIQELMANLAAYGAAIRSSAYPIYLFGLVGVGNAKAAAIVTAAVAALFGLMWVLISRSFLQVATATGKVSRAKYRETAARRKSVPMALLGRELTHFAANPNYMLNCGLGTFLMPVCALALVWKGGEVFAVLEEIFGGTEGSVSLLLATLLCGLASMNIVAAPSVSLEGKTLWLMQSLPVTPWQVLRAKLLLQIIVTAVPLALCIVCGAATYAFPPAEILMAALLALSYVLMKALFDLFLGVKNPIMTWTNEILPIKQSASVMIALFGGMGYTLVLFALFMLLPGWVLGFCGYAGCVTAVNLLLGAAMYLWLKKKGCARFAAL